MLPIMWTALKNIVVGKLNIKILPEGMFQAVAQPFFYKIKIFQIPFQIVTWVNRLILPWSNTSKTIGYLIFHKWFVSIFSKISDGDKNGKRRVIFSQHEISCHLGWTVYEVFLARPILEELLSFQIYSKQKSKYLETLKGHQYFVTAHVFSSTPRYYNILYHITDL